MAIRDIDRLAEILGDQRSDRRRDIWLWLRLCIGTPEHPQRDMRGKIANYLDGNPQLTSQLKIELERQLLPDDYFIWINEGKRQVNWINSKLLQTYGPITQLNPLNLNGMDLLLSNIDLWAIDTTQKRIILDGIKEQWEAHKKGDSTFKWFKDNNLKSALAWNWFNKNTKPLINYHLPFESYEDLLIFFDSTLLFPEQKELYIEKIKRRWGQQKYRENLKGKTQCNFVLSDKAIENLDKLSGLHEISRAKTLEILIEMEIAKNDHIPERIRTLKLLNSI